MINQETEIKQGNMSEVYRDGNLIYRDLKPQSSTIHRLLLHLERKGLPFVPRFLGFNDRNQEMLSFVDGETLEDYPIVKDLPGKAVIARQAAEMLRKYHDSTTDFVSNPEDIWFLSYEGELNKDVICHNDFAPYNITFQNNQPIGMIDFDTACPAPRIWDVAYAVYRFVPLSKEIYDPETKEYRTYDRMKDGPERKLLLDTFLATYGNMDTLEVLHQVVLRLQSLVMLFDQECNKGNAAFIKMKQEGHQLYYQNEIAFIKENMHDWI
ncbi:MAG: putative homoserine kinase type [Firmicutes bacterium]|nr:putative homoserine kinase type [Bacillota bacterium]